MIARNYWLVFGFIAVFASTSLLGLAQTPVLTPADITTVIQQAVASTPAGLNAVIAVSDREGFILAVYGVNTAPGGLTEVNAIDKAGTAAYLSSNGEAFTSRTAGFIIQGHFPPGIMNTGTGPLTGVGLSSLPFSDVNHFRNPLTPAAGIANTSLSGNPGGVPLYKNGILVGGVGVDSNSFLSALVYDGDGDVDEDIAVNAQTGYNPPSQILATQVLLNGIRLPYTSFSGFFNGPVVALNNANFDLTFPNPAAGNLAASTGLPYQPPGFTVPILPVPSPLNTISGGSVRDPIISSPLPPIPIGGGATVARLSATEVAQILYQGAIRAFETRGAIRNPIGPAEVFIVVIDYYATDPTGVPTAPNTNPGGVPVAGLYPLGKPGVLGSFRTPDATLFSYDVAAQKGRTALFFSNNTMALSARGVGFLSQGTYPPGIDGTTAGPYGPPTYGPSQPGFGVPGGPTLFPLPFGIQSAVSILPGPPPAPFGIPLTPINAYLPNGITVFPGGFPLYRNGILIGAVGVSGDGVDQDDIISASATVGFEAPDAIRSDEYSFRGARLPYAKFPQNSSL